VELKDYIRIIRKRWRIIVAVTLVVLAGAAAATALSPKVYEAQTQLFVSTSGGTDNSSNLLSGSNFTQQRVLSYANVITTPTVLDPVIKTLKLDTTATLLGNQITATVPLNTVLIQVAVTNTDPRVAAQVADALGRQFTQTVADIESVKGQASPVKLTVVSVPTVPTTPISPKPTRNLALGVVLGLLLGLGLALLRDLLDATIKGEKDCAEVSDATVIGGIGFDPDAPKHPLIVQADPHGPRAEAFRTLRTNLQFVHAANHPASIVFTS
jgi:succinoglycan biosynthesis transport protein ExoP